ncbi:hypothetical protein WH47_05525 [Habropoda laboriosa]|uniref:Uncharacterized protein n=1 Tax=Habropoda laboriosa TaxID=597456 RepID=A0A0L7RF21_9HYME|nr:hypothetical protein WH47_05525 [Habropoda laboriosa]
MPPSQSKGANNDGITEGVSAVGVESLLANLKVAAPFSLGKSQEVRARTYVAKAILLSSRTKKSRDVFQTSLDSSPRGPTVARPRAATYCTATKIVARVGFGALLCSLRGYEDAGIAFHAKPHQGLGGTVLGEFRKGYGGLMATSGDFLRSFQEFLRVVRLEREESEWHLVLQVMVELCVSMRLRGPRVFESLK